MRVGGLASGMDTDAIVRDMMKIQKMPLDKLMQQKTLMEWQKDSFRDVNLSLSNLRNLASGLRLQSTFNSYSATSSVPGAATAETSALSVSGSYKVNVERLASGAKVHSANTIMKDANNAAKSTDQIGVAGNIVIKGSGTGAVDIPIAIEATDTYEAVAKKVQDATAGKVPELRMSFDNTTSRFFISTKGMGADQNFTMDFENADGTANSALAKQVVNQESATAGEFVSSFSTSAATATDTFMSAAATGKVTFDGITVDNLNTNKTTINGLTINLLSVGESIITVQADATKTFDKIKEFVDKYNEAIGDIEKQLVEKRYPNFQPLSTEQKKDMSENEIELWEEKARSGLLRNDPVLRGAMQELRRSFMDPVAGVPNGNLNLMSQIGINTGNYTEGGKLFIDEDKLKAALTEQPDEVMALFTNRVGDQNVGVGGRVYETLNNVVKRLSDKAGSPSSLVDNSQMTKYLKQMDQDISKWQDKLSRIEDRYWKQFTAMEKALSQMNSQSAWMQQNMFGGM
ncbi:flagellar filament capping protein FliD [Planococcus halotolerans]|uniref:Flagellar hook-associated protein 2 n=1 Tax=Planococcus halotolerans TaxID=2233542 RepID=A0A365KQV0_9BACL|nr:flagellar filament capping protein FliD [Planococcus halotolerans]QHJ69581.1 flagellar filament capping protein FliD [Planococcus halotolerans]RAZ75530.1 flagellar cap protein [Planococcus halotolerans]